MKQVLEDITNAFHIGLNGCKTTGNDISSLVYRLPRIVNSFEVKEVCGICM